jgi:hypothetical protein
VALGAAFPWLYFLALRPWHRRWGATDEEVRLALPGDERVPAPGYQHTRAVTVHAPAERVWPWLAQLGQGRGGFYSYDRLENLAGCDVHSAESVHPDWQLHAGDTLRVMPGYGPRVVAAGPAPEGPGYALVIEGWGTYAVRQVDARTSRLLARARQPRGLGVLGYLLAIEIPHFVMERAMLLGIKARAEQAERAARPRTLLDAVLPAYDFRGRAAAAIDAPPAAIFRALREVTLADMPLAHALGTVRYLPGLLTSPLRRRPADATRSFFDVAGSLALAEAPDEELVVGSIGRLHDLKDQQFVALDDPAAFARFATPGYEKPAMSFRVDPAGAEGPRRLVCEHRTQALGPAARWRFALYWWLLIKWGSTLMLRLLFAAVKRRAERSASPSSPSGRSVPVRWPAGLTKCFVA